MGSGDRAGSAQLGSVRTLRHCCRQRFLAEQRGVVDPANHALAGSVRSVRCFRRRLTPAHAHAHSLACNGNALLTFASISASGYAASTYLAGVRASNAGIIGGAVTGIGLFFVLEAFEGWRRRTGLAMAQQRARQKPLQDLHNAWSAGCMTRAEYAHALNHMQEEGRSAEVLFMSASPVSSI